MADLENHFGDDASLSQEETKEILEFLIQNSAENSTMQSSLMFLNSIESSNLKKDIIAMSQTKFWEKRHKKIPKEVFKSDEIISKANCKACHNDIEKGLIENENIKNINSFIF